MSTKHTHIACNLMFIMSYCRMFSLHTLPMSIYYECNTLSPHIKFCTTHFEASQRLMIDFFCFIFLDRFSTLRWQDRRSDARKSVPKNVKNIFASSIEKKCSSFFLNKASILTGSALPVLPLRSTYYQPFVILCSNFRCLDRSLIPTLIFFEARSTSNLVGQSVRSAP